jgi:pyruvate kinase
MKPLEIMATLWPDMAHYERFATDQRLAGVRLNTTGRTVKEMPYHIKRAIETSEVPLYFDVKGRQLRIMEVGYFDSKGKQLAEDESPSAADHLELKLNHPISVSTPTPVIFKAGNDAALLDSLKDDGYRLVFDGGPRFKVKAGDSLQIRNPSLKVLGPTFTDDQLQFLQMAKSMGIDRYMLSYASSMDEIAEMRKYVGNSEIIAKIEDGKGLDFVKSYNKQPNLGLLTARGDLFVEVKRPHEILEATQRIVRADPDAILGSRILLSLCEREDPADKNSKLKLVPSCADLNELAWLVDQGYHRYMFCDDLCFKPEALNIAINIVKAVYDEYGSLAEKNAKYAMPNVLKTPFKKWFGEH